MIMYLLKMSRDMVVSPLRFASRDTSANPGDGRTCKTEVPYRGYQYIHRPERASPVRQRLLTEVMFAYIGSRELHM